MTAIEQHDLEWNDRLQDLVDGELSSAERIELESHAAGCTRCRAQLGQLQRLHTQLSAYTPRLALDASFDRELLARINVSDTAAKARARRRIEADMRDNLRTLAEHRQRGIALLAGGVIAGIALAFALLAWANTSSITSMVVHSAVDTVGTQHAGLLNILLAAFAVAGIGAGVARWIATTVD